MTRRGWQSQSVGPLVLAPKEPSPSCRGRRGSGGERSPLPRCPPSPARRPPASAAVPGSEPSGQGLPPPPRLLASSSAPSGVSAPFLPRGGVGDSRESAFGCCAFSPRFFGVAEKFALRASDLLLHHPPAPMFKLVPSASLSGTCGRGRMGRASRQVGQHHEAVISGKDFGVPLQAQAGMRGRAEKMHTFQPFPNLCDHEEGCARRDWKILSLSPSAAVTLGLVGLPSLQVGWDQRFLDPHPTQTPGSQRYSLLSLRSPLPTQLAGCYARSSFIWFPPPG